MGLFRQTGKEAKREPQKEARKENESEQKKTMFLSPEDRFSAGGRDRRRASKEDKETIDDDARRTIQGNPIIINGEDYLLRIGQTRMEALLTVYRRFTAEELRDVLKENGIVSGIREKELTEIAEGKLNYEEALVAVGTPAKDGHDGWFEYHFNPHPETEPIILPDGSVDYNVLGKIELVREGELLVTYHAPLAAVYGRDICGNDIDAYEGKGLPPLQCKRCSADEAGCKYYADVEGNVTLNGRTLTVTPIYVLDGNLDAATGSLDFHGDVLIQGNVFAGVTVKTTGNITINGHVETANLIAGKDVILKNGMQGAGNGSIRAGGRVMARFLEQTQVYAGMEVNTGALLNCEVESGQKVTVIGNRGTIIGGKVTAVEEITAASIGNRAGVDTQLVIGLDCEFKTKMSEIDRLTEEYEENMTDAIRTLDRIDYQMKNQPAIPGWNEQKAEQMRRKINYQLKLKEITTRREELIDINRRSADGKIVVSGLSNVGCAIIINGVREALHSEYRDVTYTKGRNEIRIISNKQ